ncbi:MAG TPA: LacI family DNA-binding transcriptional regulator [Acidimicrobiales bacterium]|nr:LacI family DNA-binding transcriptional regulator [Acidimicrobiales bacterium]
MTPRHVAGRLANGSQAGSPWLRLKDVAAIAGVSDATVSRVLNDKPGVAKETRQAVCAALDLLGYEWPRKPNKHRSGVVGLIVPELSNPVFPAFVQVVESALADEGYTPILCTMTAGGISEDEYIDMLLERGVNGVIFISAVHADMSADHSHYNALVQSGVPIVLVNGYLPGLPVTSISSDEDAAVRVALKHLVALGHRNIGLATGPLRYRPSLLKRDAFLRSMKELVDVDASGLVEVSFFTVEGGHAAALRLLGSDVSAIICANDLMALGAIRAVQSRGLQVPDHVSVIGYDDSFLISFTEPPLTTVRQPVRAMGEAAVRALLDELKGVPIPPNELLFHPELILRGSTGPGPAVPVADG